MTVFIQHGLLVLELHLCLRYPFDKYIWFHLDCVPIQSYHTGTFFFVIYILFLFCVSFKLWPYSFLSLLSLLGCPKVETECNGDRWTANWSYLFMHGKASVSLGIKWLSNLTIFFVGVLWHGHLARSAKNIHVPTYIAWSQKMLWALNCCHIIIYRLWCGYANSCFCYVIPFWTFKSFKQCPWLFAYSISVK